jgi:glycosyltransferase involved in cell wall biosynthesis
MRMSEFEFDLVVHATHEAGYKVGGIGAVLNGLLSSAAYNQAVQRTVLVGTMDVVNTVEMERLTDPRNKLQILYSSWHGVNQVEGRLSAGLRRLERRYRVWLLYGKRTFAGPDGKARDHEMILVDGLQADLDETNAFKLALWNHFHLQSDRYEWNDEFDGVLKAARPALAALQLVTGRMTAGASRTVIAHDWMGVPLALATKIYGPATWRTIYYAHEMPTARILVEDDPGHDTRFYNVLEQAGRAELTLGEIFGDQSGFFKHALIRQAVRMDNILAVGPWVERELRFLGGAFTTANIDVVYNGLSFHEIELAERQAAKAKLQAYCQNLLDYRPDYVLTHVTRLVISKGMWRDISVLDHLDRLLAQDGKTAVLYMLSTSLPAGRSPEDVLRWEMQYGWPVVHRSDNGDLMWHEVPLYHAIEAYNARAKAVKIVFVNQFGWNRECCGVKMPADMNFNDIRWGTDLEFGQSIYEPFGISQVEPLAYGALSVVTNICGCVDFVERAVDETGMPHFASLLQADYTSLVNGLQVYTPWDALAINQEVRDRMERANSYNVALAIRATLPTTPNQASTLLTRGQRVSRAMSWETVARDLFIPALRRAP